MKKSNYIMVLAVVAGLLAGCTDDSEDTKKKTPPPVGQTGIPDTLKNAKTPYEGTDRHKAALAYDPKLLMPLAVGNTWVYSWTSPAVKGTKEVTSAKPLLYGLQHYQYKGKGMYALAYRRAARAHQETYRVVRKDGDHYFFTVSSDPMVPNEQLRDGRYDGSIENCWTLWDKRKGGSKGECGMTATIKRKWTYPSRQYLLKGSPGDPGDHPIDNRNLIQNPGRRIFSVDDKKRITDMYEHSISKEEVVVPAGKFKHCFEYIKTAPKGREDIDKNKKKVTRKVEGGIPAWAQYVTHTFWAPGVGMVYEYQKLEGNVIAYELKLIKFTKGAE